MRQKCIAGVSDSWYNASKAVRFCCASTHRHTGSPTRLRTVIRTTRQLMRSVRRQWADQPVQVGALVALIALVVVAGPWACVAHCAMLDQMQAHRHAAHSHHGGMDAALGETCPTDMHGTHRMAEQPPTALTLAVVLALVLLPPMLFSPFWPLRRPARSATVAHPPPRYPPRSPMQFT